MQDLVNVPGKGCYLQCDRCGMQVNRTATGHQGTKTCLDMHAAKMWQEAVSTSAEVLDERFYTYGEELDRVEVFKYHG